MRDDNSPSPNLIAVGMLAAATFVAGATQQPLHSDTPPPQDDVVSVDRETSVFKGSKEDYTIRAYVDKQGNDLGVTVRHQATGDIHNLDPEVKTLRFRDATLETSDIPRLPLEHLHIASNDPDRRGR